jgi:hypothetical protein
MRQSYTEASQWWQVTGAAVLQDAALPDGLLDDGATAEPATLAGGAGDATTGAAP